MLVSETPSRIPTRADADRLLVAAARADDAARIRLGGAINDLFRPPENRLSDREHALMTGMLHALVAEIERALRMSMAVSLSAYSPVARELADKEARILLGRLARSRMLRDPELARHLLRRCDEHQLSVRLQRMSGSDAGAMERLSLSSDPILRAALSDLLIDESRRVDQHGSPLLRLDDMPIGLLHRLAWWVSALLREYLVDRSIDPEMADYALAAAVLALVEGHDHRRSIDSHAARLAVCLDPASWPNELLFDDVLREGQLAFWVAGLTCRSGIGTEAVWSMLGDIDGSRLTLLLRSIDIPGALSLTILERLFSARFGPVAEVELRLSAAAAAFEVIDRREAIIALRAYAPDQGSTVRAKGAD